MGRDDDVPGEVEPLSSPYHLVNLAGRTPASSDSGDDGG